MECFFNWLGVNRDFLLNIQNNYQVVSRVNISAELLVGSVAVSFLCATEEEEEQWVVIVVEWGM